MSHQLDFQLQLLSKCPCVVVSSAASGWYHYRHLASFMSLHGIQFIINNNILPEDYYMTAAMMNHSGGSNCHEQIEKQTKKQSVVRHLKIYLGTERFIRCWNILLTKPQGIIGVFKCAFSSQLYCAMLAHYSPALAVTWRQRGPLWD